MTTVVADGVRWPVVRAGLPLGLCAGGQPLQNGESGHSARACVHGLCVCVSVCVCERVRMCVWRERERERERERVHMCVCERVHV